MVLNDDVELPEDVADDNSADANTSNDREGQQQHQQTGTKKTVDYKFKRATGIPTVQRLYPPQPGTLIHETILQNIKRKLLKTTKEYIAKNCDSKGRIKDLHITMKAESLEPQRLLTPHHLPCMG